MENKNFIKETIERRTTGKNPKPIPFDYDPDTLELKITVVEGYSYPTYLAHVLSERLEKALKPYKAPDFSKNDRRALTIQNFVANNRGLTEKKYNELLQDSIEAQARFGKSSYHDSKESIQVYLDPDFIIANKHLLCAKSK